MSNPPAPIRVLPRRRLWLVGTSLTALTAIATAVIALRVQSAEAQPAVATPATPVSIAVVVASQVSTWDEFSGRLEAVDRVDIRPRVAGTVQSVHFREGALVKKGDLLFTIDPAPYAADVDRASAQVVAAQARDAFSRSEFERAKRLLDEHAIAQREHDASSNAMREAEAGLRSAQAALTTAKLSLGYTQVRAPVDGRAGRIEITTGNLVATGAGAPVLTTVVSVSPIYASFDADEQIVGRAIGNLHPAKGGDALALIGQIPVQMSGAGGHEVDGHLQLVDNAVDAKSGTVRVRAVFDNPNGALMPGQFAKLRMGQPQAGSALLINERAVGTDQSKKFVLVVGDDNKANYREVTLGANVNGLRIVTSGLKANERVVVNGLQRVRPGALVAPTPVSMDAKSELAPATPRS